MTASLKVISINVNSIVANHTRYERIQFVEKHKPDIFKLKIEPRLGFKNHNIMRKNRHGNIRGGSTDIIIKNQISYKEPESLYLKTLLAVNVNIIQVKNQ